MFHLMQKLSFPEQQELVGKIWDSINSGLILIDSTGKVLFWNEWISMHSGIPCEFAVSRSLESLFPGGLSAAFKSAIKNASLHKLPIVLSNALHRSPLPLYPLPITPLEQDRLQQSIAISPIALSNEISLCLIQITDASLSIKRERVLQSYSKRMSLEAVTDALTGSNNRRFFDERFAVELGRAQRLQIPLSLIMLDVDYFKRYNDEYGHPAGDRVLIAIAQTLKTQLNRTTDVLARYGGEEFVIILPDSGVDGARIVAEKLRSAIIGLNIPHLASMIADHVTISIGIATCQSLVNSAAADLLEIADRALYSAKHGGRNCIRQLIVPELRPDSKFAALS